MSSSTANKLVALFAVGGIALALYTGTDGATRYRKVWGVTVLSLGGAILADFAPGLVGPFFGLVVVAYFLGNFQKLSGVATSVKNQAGVKK
jgi:hypothetical protein